MHCVGALIDCSFFIRVADFIPHGCACLFSDLITGVFVNRILCGFCC